MGRILPKVALLSITIAAILPIGFVARIGVSHARPVLVGPSIVMSTFRLEMRGGRAICYAGQQVFQPVAPGSRAFLFAPPPGWRVLADVEGFRRLEPRQAIFGFDAHPLPMPPGRPLWIVSVPIWAMEIPFSVAPILWFRARRRTAGVAVGFAVSPA